MTRGEVLQHVATSKVYSGICRKVCNDDPLWRDLFQELIIILHNENEDYLVTLYSTDRLRFFITRILLNQYRSDQSPFYRKIRKFSDKSQPIEATAPQVTEQFHDFESNDSIVELAEISLERAQHHDSNDWYESNVVNSYLKTGSLRKLESKTGISRHSISMAVNSFKSKITAQKERLSKLDQLNFLTGSERFAIKKEVISKGLDVDEVVRLLKIKHKLCVKKSICGI